MKIVGIIAEYNPFHNGHKFHIEEAKRLTGADVVVVVMSGNYVQRGDVSIFDKQIRAKAAILGGADLVIELPTINSTQSAEGFAYNAVYLMNALNCVDYLAFGAETDGISEVAAIAKFLTAENAEFGQLIRDKLKSGISYALAREQAVGELFGENYAKILREPNNILGVEYLKALQLLNSDIEPILVKRNAVGHNDMMVQDAFASASLIRKMVKSDGLESIKHLVPSECMELYYEAKIHTLQTAETAILAGLRKSLPERIVKIADVSEGLENRIFNMAKEHNTLDDLLDAVKTKRYTQARLRRIMLHSYLGIERIDLTTPKYLKILDFNSNGQEILNRIKKTTMLPLVKNFAQLKKYCRGEPCSPDDDCFANKAIQMWERELVFDSLYELCGC